MTPVNMIFRLMEKTGNQVVKEKTRTSIVGTRTDGYTLIELGVVVFLIGLLLSLSVPRIRDTLLFDDGKSATRKIVGVINNLKSRAARERKDFSLHFDLGSNVLWVEWPDMSPEERSSAKESARNISGDVQIVDITSLYNTEQYSGEPVIHFTSKGYVEPAVIHLEAGPDESWTVVLSPFLSRIKVFDRYVDASDI